ncbi:acetyl-CoA carboxylase biotin carboxyl carrier protein [Sneathiella marina]|uniref:Biotin carboxyl carrier protein of acetyl-CoA carboxylase n=1 Tax=Sneathiella marina TaxID=2950108 RepID=A0ABY4VXJ2_9PROT|nr:acetyl-CoA carboxylase biotin carboxyl carrier protein [Sneathiella marina]USG59484.1 acetyl-CoA carboxylase biotin carboxyl carrier protein [Sneathiella marina]
MSKLDIDKKAIRELAEIMNETGLGEIEIETEDHRLRVSRSTSVTAPAPLVHAAVSTPVATPTPVEAPVVATDATSHPGAVKSPMVGTAYMSPEPTAPAFIKVGDSVSEGQTLLIVEAMKTMNPIAAPKNGKVLEILVSDKEPVEFGQPLVIVE